MLQHDRCYYTPEHLIKHWLSMFFWFFYSMSIPHPSFFRSIIIKFLIERVADIDLAVRTEGSGRRRSMFWLFQHLCLQIAPCAGRPQDCPRFMELRKGSCGYSLSWWKKMQIKISQGGKTHTHAESGAPSTGRRVLCRQSHVDSV